MLLYIYSENDEVLYNFTLLLVAFLFANKYV